MNLYRVPAWMDVYAKDRDEAEGILADILGGADIPVRVDICVDEAEVNP